MEIEVNGEQLLAMAPGALYWPHKNVLAVSDLHFEKGSHFATRGVFLPPYDTRATLRRLASLVTSLRPQTVISLGDAFHDRGAEARMDEEDAALLQSLTSLARFIWILGNHDPEPPARFAGDIEQAARIGRLIFRHEPAPRDEPGEIAGHLHPCARVVAETRIVRRRCFASDGERLVMPAFGAYAGGLDVLDPAIAGLFGRRGFRVMLTGRERVYMFPHRALDAALAPVLG